MREAQTLNIYNGTDATGNSTTIVAEDMATAATVYKRQNEADPIILQRTKAGVSCVLPEYYVTFKAEAYDQTTGAVTTACAVTPAAYYLLAGSKQVFTATAGEGYQFVKWQIDGADVADATEPVAMLTIPESATANCTIRAVFKLVD